MGIYAYIWDKIKKCKCSYFYELFIFQNLLDRIIRGIGEGTYSSLLINNMVTTQTKNKWIIYIS